MPTSLDIANYIIKKMKHEYGESITHLKLQKLMYYSQGIALSHFGSPLFEEDIYAWEHGPVVREVYDSFKFYSGRPLPEANSIQIPSIAQQVTKITIELYGHFSAWTLRNMTHEESPWISTPQSQVIPKSLIKEYFLEEIIL